MYQMVSKGDFRDAFQAMGRGDNFSYAGLGALYDYLEDGYSGDGLGLELDVIALCVEFSEYADLAEFQADYGEDEYETMEDVENATVVIPVDSEAFIIQNF